MALSLLRKVDLWSILLLQAVAVAVLGLTLPAAAAARAAYLRDPLV
jgi:hypothetical protein